MGGAIRASVLVLLLGCSARAGIMQNPQPQPPPPPSQSTQEATTEGIIQNGLTQLALTLFALI